MSARDKTFRRGNISTAPEHCGDNPWFPTPKDLLAVLQNLPFPLKAWDTFLQKQLKDFH